MIPELRTQTLGAVARRLDLDPFEVVRLAVAAGLKLDRLALSAADTETLSSFGGLDRFLKAPPVLPADASPKRALVRAALGQLVERGFVGSQATRRDNLWRGLDPDEQVILSDAIDALVEGGALLQRTEAAGTLVSVAPEQANIVRGMVAGDVPIPGF